MPENSFVAIAKIAKPHGIGGEFSAVPFIDGEYVEERFGALKEFFLKAPQDAGGYRRCAVSSVKFTPRYVIIGSPDVTLADAQRLYNSFVFIRRSDAMDLPEGVFYACDLIGAKVYDVEGGLRGEVSDAINSTGNDLIEVSLACDGRKVLVPFVGEFVKKVDVKAGAVVVNFMEGLI